MACVSRLRCNVVSYPQAVLTKAILFCRRCRDRNKIGAGPRPRVPGPDLDPHPPNPRGWGRHNLHSYCDAQWARSSLCSIVVDCCAWVTSQSANIFGTHSNPARTSQTYQVPARCIAPSIANCDDRDSARVIACRDHHWPVCIRSNGAACADEPGRETSRLCPCAEPFAGTKLLSLA